MRPLNNFPGQLTAYTRHHVCARNGVSVLRIGPLMPESYRHVEIFEIDK